MARSAPPFSIVARRASGLIDPVSGEMTPLVLPLRSIEQVVAHGDGFMALATRDQAPPALVDISLKSAPRVIRSASPVSLAKGMVSRGRMLEIAGQRRRAGPCALLCADQRALAGAARGASAGDPVCARRADGRRRSRPQAQDPVLDEPRVRRARCRLFRVDGLRARLSAPARGAMGRARCRRHDRGWRSPGARRAGGRLAS